MNIGDKLTPIAFPPWTLQDQIAYHNIGHGLTARSLDQRPSGPKCYEAFYKFAKNPVGWFAPTHIHPITRWPYTPTSEHEDALLAIFRGLPMPFDFGVQRIQIPQKLLTNWMGDNGFIRRMYIALRKTVFYGDATWYKGVVTNKYIVKERGTDASGAVPGEAEYGAISIKISGINQKGEEQAPGGGVVYLPSKKLGQVKLPIPHPPAEKIYVPYDEHSRWGAK